MSLQSTKLEEVIREEYPSMLRFVIEVSLTNQLATELRHFMR
jgi:hypothetical protein